MKPYYLYRITAPDGRAYIGVSECPRTRWSKHCRDHQSAIYDAARTFGRTTMRFETLACGSREYIYELEINAIRVFQTRLPDGFNKNAGGFGCRDPLPQTRAKMKNNSSWAKGMRLSDSHRANISAARMGHPPTGPKKHSAEARAKMVAARKRRSTTDKTLG